MRNILLVLLFALGFSSCERCVTCRQKSPSGNVVIEYPETCGSKANILDYQDRLETRKIPGNSVECTQKTILPWN